MINEKCEDDATLARLIDDELSVDLAEMIMFHIGSCKPCEDRMGELQALRSFCSEHLGKEDEVEFEYSEVVVQRVRESIAVSVKETDSVRTAGWWSRFSSGLNWAIKNVELSWPKLGATAITATVLIGFGVWFLGSPIRTISAGDLLEESELKAGIWRNQPNKVLFWEATEEVSASRSGLPDGKYIVQTWQNNIGGNTERIIRRYSENGQLAAGVWDRADGSGVVYLRSPIETLKIFPTTDALWTYAQGLEDESRKMMMDHLQSREKVSQSRAEMDSQYKLESARDWALGSKVEIIETPNVGRTFRVFVEDKLYPQNFVYQTTEYEISADTFLRHRFRVVRNYTDRRSSLEDWRLTSNRESSLDEFKANVLDAEIERMGKRVIRVTPADILESIKKTKK